MWNLQTETEAQDESNDDKALTAASLYRRTEIETLTFGDLTLSYFQADATIFYNLAASGTIFDNLMGLIRYEAYGGSFIITGECNTMSSSLRRDLVLAFDSRITVGDYNWTVRVTVLHEGTQPQSVSVSTENGNRIRFIVAPGSSERFEFEIEGIHTDFATLSL